MLRMNTAQADPRDANTQAAYQAPVVSFWFCVDELRERMHETIPPRADQHHWLPPKMLGCNVLDCDVSELPPRGKRWYRFTSGEARLFSTTTEPQGYRLFSTYSLYEHRSTIWTVPYDASQHMVGDGRHNLDELEDDYSYPTADNSDEEGEQSEELLTDWRELGFRYISGQGYCISYAVHDGGEKSLRFEPYLQDTWIPQLLPDPYRTGERPPDGVQVRGGMAGRLALLIGLIALSVHPSRVDEAFTESIQGLQWQAHHQSNPDRRRDKFSRGY